MDSTRLLLRLPVLTLLFLISTAHSQDSILGFTTKGTAQETAVEQKFKAIPSPDEERRQHRIFTSASRTLPGLNATMNSRATSPTSGESKDWKTSSFAAMTFTAPLQRVLFWRWSRQSTTARLCGKNRMTADPDTKNPGVSAAWMGMSTLRRSHGASRLCAQRQSRRLRPAAQERHRRQRQDRARPLLESLQLSRIQGAHRAAGRRGRDPDLQRSAEDGYKKGKVFPDGPWGPEDHIQRGAITYDFMVPGDPLTPGWASVPGAKRIPVDEAVSLPKIMALPLSWHDAKPLLENMGGPVAPDDWQGGLPFKYHLGGEQARVHLKIEMDNSHPTLLRGRRPHSRL